MSQQAELLPNGWLQTLRTNHAEQGDAPAPELLSPETISDVSDATIAVLQMFHFPVELIPFALAVVACAEGRLDWFGCADRHLAARAMGEDTRSPEAKKKWVQRRRDELIKWQATTGFVLIECAPGGMRNNERFESQYCAHLLKFIYECINLVNTPGGGSFTKSEDRFKSAAFKVLPDAMKALAHAQAKHERFNRPRQDAEARINRNLKTSLAYLEKAVETVKASGGSPSELITSHLDTIKARFDLSDANSVHTLVDKYSGQDEDTGGAVQGGAMDTPMDTPMDKCVHSPAEQAVGIFESVGFEGFGLVVRDEQTEKAVESVTLDAPALRAQLPLYLRRNARGLQSLIIRPVMAEGASRRLIQIDEASAEVLKMLAPVSFFQIETSEGNGQAFLAVDGLTDERAFIELRERLLLKLKHTGANGGSYGALRWPGSLNCKPSRRGADGSFPRVRIVFSNAGRLTTQAELESLNLLAPVPSPLPTASRAPVTRATRPRQWPSYEIELERAARRERDNKPDRSDADINFSIKCLRWGWPESETAAKLREVSEKARGRRFNYAEETAHKAALIVGA
jgi:hypothetical protein